MNDTHHFNSLENSHLPVLRWAVIGCGSICKNFVRALGIGNRNHQITLIASNSLETSESFKNNLNLANNVKTYGNYFNALQSIEDYDIAYVGIQAEQHAEIVDWALEQKKHVLCERPLAMNAEQVTKLISKARKVKCFLMEGYWSRFFPSWQKLKKSLCDIGEIHLVQANLCFNKSKIDHNTNSHFDLVNNKSNNDLVSSLSHLTTSETTLNSVNNLGCALYSGAGYTINLALWVFNSEMPIRIAAIGKTDKNGNNIWGNIMLEFSKNRIATLFYSTIQGCYSPAYVVGNNGILSFPNQFWCATELIEEYGNPRGIESKQIHKYPISKDNKGFQYPNGNAFYFEADHVFDCIAQGKLESKIMPLDDSLKVAKIIDQVREKIILSSS